MRGALTASLKYHWRRHLAVAGGAAVATAVLTGALLVGDSVRGSLRDLALDRLGKTDLAVVNDGYFRQALAAEVSRSGGIEAAPVSLLPAAAVHASSGARASNVTLVGMNDAFLGLFEGADATAWSFEGGSPAFPPVILNQALANELGAAVEDAVLVSFTRATDVPRASLLGRRSAGDVVQRLRMTVTAVVPSEGPGAFALTPDQAIPKNAYLPLPRLQRLLGREGQVNALLLAAPAMPEETVHTAVSGSLTVEDLGIRLLPSKDGERLTVESERYVLRPETASSVHALAQERGTPSAGYLTYLANKIRLEGSDALTPYSTVTALDFEHAETLGSLEYLDGEAPAESEILLSQWTAADLGASVGDEVTLEYFVVGEGEQLLTREATFNVSGIVALSGLAADGTLTPEYEGISDADNMADWDPPFPVELDLVRPKDEDYWDTYRGAPKAFLPLPVGQELWRSRFGELTGIRLGFPGEGSDSSTVEALAQGLATGARLEPYGFEPRPVKARALEASSGATAFSGLFLGFSWFLIVAAVLLVVLLFRLGVEQRAKEVGLLRAVGFPEASVRRRFLVEGGAVAFLGALVGLAGAVGYAALMMAGLRTWWVGAVGSRQLELYVTPLSLVLGLVISLAVTVGTIQLALRRLRRVATPSLLAGSVAETRKGGRKQSGGLARWVAWGALALAASLLALSLVTGQEASTGLSFGIGAAVLVAGIAFFALWCRGAGAGESRLTGSFALLRMAVRNSARNPGRSLLSLTLVACACFVIVAVEAARQKIGEEELQNKDSGAGGFALVAESDVPLFQDLASPQGRFELGLEPEAEELLESGAVVHALRELPGDEASCLNLFQPQKPRLLGVGEAFRKRGGFHFQETVKTEAANPWQLLSADLGQDPETGARIVPAIGDYESAMWILKLPLGSELEMEGEAGEPILLRIVGLLHASLFQSELLISEENLQRHFPSREGYSFFLLEAPPERAPELATALESSLGDFGFDTITTRDRLARYSAVRNTYISTFQSLGALGLLLGTVGLAVILLRNVLERRGELAAMRAFGFRRRRLSRMVLVENAFVLLLGILLGSGAALLAVAPYLTASGAAGSQVPWASLLFTLAAIAAVGISACAWAAGQALKAHLLPALKGL